MMNEGQVRANALQSLIETGQNFAESVPPGSRVLQTILGICGITIGGEMVYHDPIHHRVMVNVGEHGRPRTTSWPIEEVVLFEQENGRS